MEEALQEHGLLDEASSVIVIEMAKLQARTVGDTEDFVVTREFKALATPEQRVDILRACFAIGAENGTISAEEAGVINQIARELEIDQDTVNDVRSRFHELRHRSRPSDASRIRPAARAPADERIVQASWRSTTPSPSRRLTSASRSAS